MSFCVNFSAIHSTLAGNIDLPIRSSSSLNVAQLFFGIQFLFGELPTTAVVRFYVNSFKLYLVSLPLSEVEQEIPVFCEGGPKQLDRLGLLLVKRKNFYR